MTGVMMLRACLLLALFLVGCPSTPTPSPSAGSQQVRDPDWWIGAWEVDVDRLMLDADRDGLSPDAKRIAEALARRIAPQYRYELARDGMRRKTPRADDIVAVTVRVLNPDVVQIDAGSAGRLRMRRKAGGVQLTDGEATFPVRRPALR